MKICHVITRMNVGGAQENTLLSIRGAIEKGHDVTLLTGPSAGPEGALLRRKPCPGLRVAECPDLVREISPLHDLKAYFFMKRFFREGGFDVVHTHSTKAGILGRIAACRAHVPLVVHTVHGLAFHAYQSRLKNLIYAACERIAARCSGRIYAVAQAMVDQCLAVHAGKPEQYRVVYSGMELEPFLESKPDPVLREKLGIPEHAKVAATLARLFPEKGYEDFIPSALELAKTVPDLYFLLIGDGILTESIRKQVADAGFAKRFIFAGLVAPDEVHRYLALSDLLVHLSLHEGLPRAAVQSLACGKPVVAYPLDGTPEVVLDGKTGVLVPPRDIPAVENAVKRLLESPELRAEFGAAGRSLVSARFGWKLMADTLLEDYAAHLPRKKD